MRLLITIDTEADCDTHWNRPYPYSFSSVLIGIPQFLRPLWNKYNIKPIYFVSPEVLENNDCCAVLKNEIKLGAIIGAHLHSEYIEPDKTENKGKPSYEFPCFAHSTDIEFEKIKNLTELIKQKLNITPEWYRAARYGADIDTIKSLAKLGYKFDSSITPNIDWTKQGGPNHKNAPEQPYWISERNFHKTVDEGDSIGIKEYPITISGKRGGIFKRFLPESWLFYNWLRPSHMTVSEQKKLMKKFSETFKDPTFVVIFHSMEIMINKTPFVRSKFMQKLFLQRLEKTIIYFQSLSKASY